jgi:PKHD-type hydroxylase
MLYDWYFVKNLYSVKECAELLEICKQSQSPHIKDIRTEQKNLNVISIETSNLGPSVDKFFDFSKGVNRRMFGFDIWPERPLALNLNVYESGQEYPYHRDKNAVGEMSDVKLTVILNLSVQKYSGGEFYFLMGEDNHIPEIAEPGTILIFPSYLYHKVNPVTSGQRITLSAWLEGPNWR